MEVRNIQEIFCRVLIFLKHLLNKVKMKVDTAETAECDHFGTEIN